MNKIKEHREARQLTQSDVAARLGISQGAVAHYEKNRRNPNLEMCRAIVQLLSEAGEECTLDDVFPEAIEAA